jgi:hypothetical protein
MVVELDVDAGAAAAQAALGDVLGDHPGQHHHRVGRERQVDAHRRADRRRVATALKKTAWRDRSRRWMLASCCHDVHRNLMLSGACDTEATSIGIPAIASNPADPL